METSGAVYGVSLGPGDPDLITLKGYRALQEADKVYFPGSLYSDGTKKSFSEGILTHHGIEADRFRGIYLSMKPDRERNEAIYEEAAKEIEADHGAGKRVAIVSQGDISFYSTFGYLLEKLHDKEVPVVSIPGVPSFLAGASTWQQSLCRQREPMLVLPESLSPERIEANLKEVPALVIMKIRKGFEQLLPFLERTEHDWFYGERLGTEEEFSTEKVADLYEREIPYFALLLIRRKEA